ncbi:MAG: DinB family protein [Gemmatimonadales bacterium]
MSLRHHLQRLLDWEEAHVGFDAAVDGLPVRYRGTVPDGLPWSPWQLLEHLRRAQEDILDFCINPDYQSRKWPDDYWPADPAPPSAGAWNESLAGFRKDRDALKRLVADPDIDLLARIPHGSGQTYLRELLLVADHTAYHVGQIVAVRRALGAWK